MPFQIIRADITTVSADAIVNTANPEPVWGRGTDGAVYAAAGREALLEERKKIGKMEVGQAAATPAFALHAKHIIHTVGPVWQGGGAGEEQALRSCYENSLRLAKELKCESIAFPLISTGTYGFPKALALQTAVKAFGEFLEREDMEIVLVVFGRDAFELAGEFYKGVDAYIDENYVEQKYIEEYGGRGGSQGPDSRIPGSRIPDSSCQEGRVQDTGIQQKHTGGKKKRGKKAEMMADGASSMMGSLGILGAVAFSKMPMPKRFETKKSVSETPVFQEAYSEAFVPDARSLDDVVAQVSETFQESLFRLIDEKGFQKDSEVYRRANVDRKLFSKIRCNADYQPKKDTAVAFALALELNLDETKDLLARAGYALSPSSKSDLIVQYFIQNRVYDIYSVNMALFAHDLPILGG